MNFNKNWIMKNIQKINEEKKKKKLHPAMWISILVFAGLLPPIHGQTDPVAFYMAFWIATTSNLDLPMLPPIIDLDYFLETIKIINSMLNPGPSEKQLWNSVVTEFVNQKMINDPNFIKKFPVFFDGIYSTKSFQVFWETYFGGPGAHFSSFDNLTFKVSTRVYFEEYWTSITTQMPYEDYWNNFEKHVPIKKV